ncbi:protoheme IX farnesyltransferase [Humitalea rosea]|uniref:Protoheme IX farnesyltransferase n=1 Tax=Humitalea rosea TaxID=990373 RepID=A0A2W7I8F7_9PROT|nr:heme o synthase [Humitalea rosea]PZW43176.1 protoheme IX farnesyltransferase [Humitalea rosea]
MSDASLTTKGALAPFDVSSDLSEVSDWVALLKPRVMMLVVFTGAVGMAIAPGHQHWVLSLVAILCIAIASGAAGAINMWFDRDIDAVMRRTAQRPVPMGRIAPNGALGFGVTLSVFSVTLMGLATNWVAASMLAGSIGFYVFVYTMWLKRRTPQNIVIGGAAGAFPPIIGWAAVTGGTALPPIVLFLIIFLWTPPHFWSLSLWAHADYERAGVPMLPVVAGQKETRRQILIYAAVLFPVGLAPWALGFAGPAYAVVAAGLGAWFLHACWKVFSDAQDAEGRSLTKDAPARWAFRVSLIHLAGIFAAIAMDHWIFG